MSRKFNQNEVEKFFKNNNCELLDKYVDCKTKMKYRCSCGNISEISFDNFKRGKRCLLCSKEKVRDKLKHNIEYVKNCFINQNCIPLFEEYINYHTPLKYICECGEIGNTTLADFNNGKRCGNCRVEKILKTMYANSTQTCSKQQKFIHNIVGGELNYPIKTISLDIAFTSEKIYLEYDGSGHDLSVKLGNVTNEEFLEKEKRRRYALYKNGWKEIRIISKNDKMPSEIKIKEMIEYAKNYFTKNHHWICFNISDSIVVSSQFNIEYDYGKLVKIK